MRVFDLMTGKYHISMSDHPIDALRCTRKRYEQDFYAHKGDARIFFRKKVIALGDFSVYLDVLPFLWKEACRVDRIPTDSKFVVFSETNHFAKAYNEVFRTGKFNS